MAQGDTDARHQLVHSEGLGHVVVRTEIESLYDAGLVSAARYDDHGNRRGFLRELPQKLMALDVRQAEIKKDAIGRAGRYGGKRGPAIRGWNDLVALRPQACLQEPADGRLVV